MIHDDRRESSGLGLIKRIARVALRCNRGRSDKASGRKVLPWHGPLARVESTEYTSHGKYLSADRLRGSIASARLATRL